MKRQMYLILILVLLCSLSQCLHGQPPTALSLQKQVLTMLLFSPLELLEKKLVYIRRAFFYFYLLFCNNSYPILQDSLFPNRMARSRTGMM